MAKRIRADPPKKRRTATTPLVFRMKTVVGSRRDVALGRELFRKVVDSCCDVDGFLAAYFLVDKRSGRMVTLSLWSRKGALKQALDKLRRLMSTDARAAAMAARVNSHGARFDTFELTDAYEGRLRK